MTTFSAFGYLLTGFILGAAFALSLGWVASLIQFIKRISDQHIELDRIREQAKTESFIRLSAKAEKMLDRISYPATVFPEKRGPENSCNPPSLPTTLTKERNG